jgi:hypothetical protein
VTKEPVFKIEDAAVIPEWFDAMLERVLTASGSPPDDVTPTSGTPEAPAPEKAPVGRSRRSSRLLQGVWVPRWKWSLAHRVLRASGEPYEATATEGGVDVKTTDRGLAVLQRFIAPGWKGVGS